MSDDSMSDNELFLGVDQGSSSTKGLLVDATGNAVQEFAAAVPERIDNNPCVEQDPEGLLTSVTEVFNRAVAWSNEQGVKIRAAGLAVQRSGVLAWNSIDGRPRHPVITWADTRTAPIIQNFGRGVERISLKTGLPTIPNFAAGKIHLLQRHFLEPSIYVATLDAFLLHRMSGKKVFVTEDTMAARTMLYALTERGWSNDLCRDFEVDPHRLPRINPSLAPHTHYAGVPIVALLGDQQAALIGRSGIKRRPLLNLGTIAALTLDIGCNVVQKTGMMTSVLLSRLIPNSYAREMKFLIETTSPVTGTVLLEPLRREWCKSSKELNAMCERAEQEHLQGRATAYFVNHRHSLPKWEHGVPNVMVSKPDATTADRARAIVENVGNLVVRMLEEFSDKGLLGEVLPSEIDVAGGGSELGYLLQYISDVSGHILHRLATHEAGSRGAALCAWMSVNNEFEAHQFNQQEPSRSYRCERPERRKRYLMWQRLEQDTLNGALPAHAEVEPV